MPGLPPRRFADCALGQGRIVSLGSRMKVLLLAGANSIHTARWANGLALRGHQVHLVSAHAATHPLDARVKLHLLRIQAPWAYLLAARQVRVIAKRVDADIVNAHYATGYGLLARLAAVKPTLLSVWGSDVYSFPDKSVFHKTLLRGNLKSSTAVASTSHCMARKAQEIYPHPHVFITPFGVDARAFQPQSRSPVSNRVVIGTVKSLSPVYGIDVLIRAFAWARDQVNESTDLQLEIFGEGPQRPELEALVETLHLAKQVRFGGAIAHEQVPAVLNQLDIFVALSRFESFGVAVLEAAACRLPVLVSAAEGLAEVTRDGVNGYVVPREDVQAAGAALLRLIQDPELRARFGEAGRRHVVDQYSWERSLDAMLDAYAQTIALARQ
jgi:L-malate glycosyltransferase